MWRAPYCFIARESLTARVGLERGQFERHVKSVMYSNVIGSLSTRVFETLTAAGSELFSLLTCLHTTEFALPSIFSPLEMLDIKVWETPLSWHAKCPLPVAVRVSKTCVLKLPNVFHYQWVEQVGVFVWSGKCPKTLRIKQDMTIHKNRGGPYVHPFLFSLYLHPSPTSFFHCTVPTQTESLEQATATGECERQSNGPQVSRWPGLSFLPTERTAIVILYYNQRNWWAVRAWMCHKNYLAAIPGLTPIVRG